MRLKNGYTQYLTSPDLVKESGAKETPSSANGLAPATVFPGPPKVFQLSSVNNHSRPRTNSSNPFGVFANRIRGPKQAKNANEASSTAISL